MDVDPEKIVVTSGAQQAIDLAVRSVVEPGTPVIVERPAYYGALNALRGAGAQILEAPLDGDGIDLQSVETHLVEHQVRLIYVNPTFQNPTGQTMSETKRRDLLALARRFDAVILEDDHSSDWRFAGRPVPAIAALAGPEHRVFYAYSFGKTLLPGQRFRLPRRPARLAPRRAQSKSGARSARPLVFTGSACALSPARQSRSFLRGSADQLRRASEKLAPAAVGPNAAGNKNQRAGRRLELLDHLARRGGGVGTLFPRRPAGASPSSRAKPFSRRSRTSKLCA